MTDERDLAQRWTESGSDAPSQLAGLLTQARGDLPTVGDRARLETKLAALFATAAPLSLGASEAASEVSHVAKGGFQAAKFGSTPKLVAVVLGVGLAAGGTWWLTSGPNAGSNTAKDGDSASVAGTAAPANAQAAVSEGTASAAVAPTPSLAESSPAAALPTQAATGEATAGKAAGEKTAPAMSEARLLELARAALAQNPKRALELTEKHRKLYPKGLLSEEREVIAIEALRRSGQSGDAKSRTERFEKSYPDSVHRDSVHR
jgi:hypothetical protein